MRLLCIWDIHICILKSVSFSLITGSDKQIDVIDVSRQCDLKMRLGDFVEYYNSPNRDKVLNVISLEFSETRYRKDIHFTHRSVHHYDAVPCYVCIMFTSLSNQLL